MPSSPGEPAYSVVLSDDALFVYLRITGRADEAAVDAALDAIATMPYISRRYDPVYEAAKPPFPVRVLYAGHFGIYYEVDDDAMRVGVVFIEDQRRDPMARFTDIRSFYGDGE